MTLSSMTDALSQSRTRKKEFLEERSKRRGRIEPHHKQQRDGEQKKEN